MMETLNLIILVISGLIIVSVVTSLVSYRIGVPLLLVFLAVGLAAGEDGVGHVIFDDAPTAYAISNLALAFILFDSGFETRMHSYRVAAGPALVLATVGVLLTTLILAFVAHTVLDFSWFDGFLMGAIVSSTDAAAVFFLLRIGGITLRDRVRSILEIESGSNDPMAIFLTVALVNAATLTNVDQTISAQIFHVIRLFISQLGVGVLGGVLGGGIIIFSINRLKLDSGLYPVFVFSLVLAVFSAVNLLEGSGFLAVYLCGLLIGNAHIRPMGGTLRRFQSAMTWLCQIGMFLTLGLLATPSRFLSVIAPALLIAFVLIFVARPLAVWACLMPFGFSRNETTFVAWVGLRGAVSILLALAPVIGGMPSGQAFFNAAFIVVLLSLLVQGWTIRPMARWLGLIVPPRLGPVDRVELELPGVAGQDSGHELVVYRIAPESPVAKGRALPRWARPSLVVRYGRSMRIHDAGNLLSGDQVYIFTQTPQIPLLDRLFASPTPLVEDDRDFFGDFQLSPDTLLSELADTYGLPVATELRCLSVADFFNREFSGKVEVGDRLPLGPVELIVRAVDGDDAVTEAGLALEPTRASKPKLPIFQSRKELRALFSRLCR
ncbi:K(+)/H(+) antiporter NhaP2 [Azospirillaceae bacterium]